MASQEQIAANRRNAEKSTGPRTAEGKARAARNAIKHGLLSREVVLQTEDRAEFETFRDEMIADFHPAGALECLLADQVVASAWRLARVLRCLRERLEEDLVAAVENWEETTAKRKAYNPECKDLRPVTLGVALTKTFSAQVPYDTLHRYEVHIERSMYKALRELRRAQAARGASRGAAEPEAPRDEGRIAADASVDGDGQSESTAAAEGHISKRSQSDRPEPGTRKPESGTGNPEPGTRVRRGGSRSPQSGGKGPKSTRRRPNGRAGSGAKPRKA